ncbi:hypothetical protein D3C85_1055580 [compost metagenome]
MAAPAADFCLLHLRRAAARAGPRRRHCRHLAVGRLCRGRRAAGPHPGGKPVLHAVLPGGRGLGDPHDGARLAPPSLEGRDPCRRPLLSRPGGLRRRAGAHVFRPDACRRAAGLERRHPAPAQRPARRAGGGARTDPGSAGRAPLATGPRPSAAVSAGQRRRQFHRTRGRGRPAGIECAPLARPQCRCAPFTCDAPLRQRMQRHRQHLRRQRPQAGGMPARAAGALQRRAA